MTEQRKRAQDEQYLENIIDNVENESKDENPPLPEMMTEEERQRDAEVLEMLLTELGEQRAMENATKAEERLAALLDMRAAFKRQHEFLCALL